MEVRFFFTCHCVVCSPVEKLTNAPDLSLSQIIPMLDEETGAEPRVNSASIADPYLLLVRDDASIYVAEIDNNLELEELEKESKALLTTKWLAGCLYIDTTKVFAEEVAAKKSKPKESSVLMFLLSAGGALHVSSPLLFSLVAWLNCSDIPSAGSCQPDIRCGRSFVHPPRAFGGLRC